jgi:hypothetical protein
MPCEDRGDFWIAQMPYFKIALISTWKPTNRMLLPDGTVEVPLPRPRSDGDFETTEELPMSSAAV